MAVSEDGNISVTSSGAVYGSKGHLPGMSGQFLAAPIVGVDAAPADNGYWLVGSDGGVFAFGDAGFYGSMGGRTLNRPIVGISSTPTGRGYWLVASDGGVFAFGDARFDGSTGGQHLNAPIVGLASTSYSAVSDPPQSAASGYYLVGADGGVFAFGNAQFDGSMGGHPLNAPIVGMTSTSYPALFYEAIHPAGSGYYLLGADGGIFAFGDAAFQGSALGSGDGTAIGIATTSINSPVLIRPWIAPSVFTSEGDILYWLLP